MAGGRSNKSLVSGTRAAPALFALLVLGASARAQSFDDTVQAFYGWVLANPSRGLPSARERVDLANLLSLELITLLRTAAETQARCVEAAPQGDKPLIVEGDLFVGNHEGATEIVAGKPRRDGDRVIVESDLFYVDDRFPKAHKHRAVAWRDRLVLRLVGKRWLIEDVEFQGNRTLVSALREYIAEGARACGIPGPSKS